MLLLFLLSAAVPLNTCMTFVSHDPSDADGREKSNLLSALKRKGFHMISTPELLTDDLPDRSPAEIAALISMYRIKKPQPPPVRPSLHCQPPAHPNNQQLDPAALQPAPAPQPDNQPSPIEAWFRLIHGHMQFRDKRDDLSSAISESLETIQKQEQEQQQDEEDEAEFDLSNVYEYICECMDGRYPRQLTIQESGIVVNLLEELKSVAGESAGGWGGLGFLSEGRWWKNGHQEGHDHHHDEQDDGSGGEADSGSAAPLPPVLQQFLTSCLQYSKIKRIASCLNPLQVPVSLLLRQQQPLFKQKHDTSTAAGAAVLVHSQHQEL